MHVLRSILVLASAASLFVACGGDSPTGGTEGNREILANPAFGANIQEIFDRRGCAASGCHVSGGFGPMTLTSGSSYGNLVNVVSAGEPPIIRVVPNDADNSYLVIKVSGTQTFGGRMPLGLGALDNIDMTNIRNWINNGAPNN